MALLKVSLTKIIDYDFPTWGEFEFIDLSGNICLFQEKLPVIGLEEPKSAASYPLGAFMECTVMAISKSGVLVDIGSPHRIESVDGKTCFWVASETVLDQETKIPADNR